MSLGSEPASSAARPAPASRVVRFASGRVGSVLLMAVVVAAIALSHAVPPARANWNFREQRILELGWARLGGPDRAARVAGNADARFDDHGLALLMAGALWLSGEGVRPTPPRVAPRVFHHLHLALDVCAFWLLWVALGALADPLVASGVVLAFLGGSSLRFVLFADDVYLFPLYAGVLLLLALSRLARPGPRAVATVGAAVAGIALCEACRSGSAVVALGFALAAAFPRALDATRAPLVRFRGLGAFALLTVLGLASAALAPERKHSVWHQFHAGLMEFGGYVDATGRVYPALAGTDEVPAGSTPVAGWRDSLQFGVARRADPGVALYSSAYEAILREDFLRIVRAHPAGVLEHLLRRAGRFLRANPWQAVSPTSEYPASRWDPAVPALGLLGLVVAVRARVPGRTWLAVGGVAPLALPALLTHSGYVMYNLPGYLPLYLLAAATVRALAGSGASRRRPATTATSPRPEGSTLPAPGPRDVAG